VWAVVSYTTTYSCPAPNYGNLVGTSCNYFTQQATIASYTYSCPAPNYGTPTLTGFGELCNYFTPATVTNNYSCPSPPGGTPTLTGFGELCNYFVPATQPPSTAYVVDLCNANTYALLYSWPSSSFNSSGTISGSYPNSGPGTISFIALFSSPGAMDNGYCGGPTNPDPSGNYGIANSQPETVTWAFDFSNYALHIQPNSGVATNGLPNVLALDSQTNPTASFTLTSLDAATGTAALPSNPSPLPTNVAIYTYGANYNCFSSTVTGGGVTPESSINGCPLNLPAPFSATATAGYAVNISSAGPIACDSNVPAGSINCQAYWVEGWVLENWNGNYYIGYCSNEMEIEWYTPPPSVTLSASPTTLITGQATTLTATTTNAPGYAVSICTTGSGGGGETSATCTSGSTESVTHNTAGTYYFQSLIAAPGATIPYSSNVVAVTWNPPPSIALTVSPTTLQPIDNSFALTATVANAPSSGYDAFVCDTTTGTLLGPLSGTVTQSTAQTDNFVAYMTNTSGNTSICSGSTTNVIATSNAVSATWYVPACPAGYGGAYPNCVAPDPTATTVSCSPNPTVIGTSVTCVATVIDTTTNTPASSGSVTISGPNGGFGSGALNSAGQFSATTATLPQGAYINTAAYAGVAGVYASSSGTTVESIPAVYPT
jgi:hypothetical protein